MKNKCVMSKFILDIKCFVYKALWLILLSVVALVHAESNLKFGFLTDTHLTSEASSANLVKGAFNVFKTQGVDLIVHGGDIANEYNPTAYELYYNTFTTAFSENAPETLFAVGNHDRLNLPTGTTVRQAYDSVLAGVYAPNQVPSVQQVNGYTFIVMPFSDEIGTEGFPTWLEYETTISNACEQAGSGKPVFLLEHAPPQDTVYNSINWGCAKSRSILNHYPQIVELSGHVHGSLMNDLFIWQGAFTVVNACCLSSWNGLLNGAAASEGKASYGVLVVDVQDTQIEVTRWDVRDGTEMCSDSRWVIPLPFNADTAPYNRETLKAAEPIPAFAEEDSISVSSNATTFAGYTFTFPDGLANTMTYWLVLEEKISDTEWREVTNTEIFSNFWKSESERAATASYTLGVSNFEPNTCYRFSVQPVNPYGVKGNALMVEVTTPTEFPAETPDAFVEYVRSTGGEYIDTGIIGRSGTKCELDLLFESIGGDMAVLDARKDDGESRFYLFHTSAGFASYGYGGYFRQDDDGKLLTYQRYFVQSELRQNKQELILNGKVFDSQQLGSIYNTECSLYLFATHYAEKSGGSFGGYMRLYGGKIWQQDANGEYQLRRDFKPCIKSGRGALYDAVSKRIFYAKSVNGSTNEQYLRVPPSGAVEPGKPDYFVSYIESDGRQVFNTGVPARTGVKMETDMCCTAHTEMEQTYLGAVSSVGRFYVWHIAYANCWCGCDTVGLYLTNTVTSSYQKFPTSKTHIVVDMTDYKHISVLYEGREIVPEGSENLGKYFDTGATLTLFQARLWELYNYRAYMRCYGLKLWLDGKLVRDFHPCVKNGKGALYDSVRDEVIFPLGDITDNLIGPVADITDESEISFVDYIEGMGAHYIDTGVIGRSGTKAEMDVMFTTGNGNDVGYLDVRKDNNNTRFFLLHRANKDFCLGYGTFIYTYKYNLNENQRYKVVSDLRAGSQTMDVDGTRIWSASDSQVIDTGKPLYLFAANFTSRYYSKSRCYGLKIWQTDTTDKNDTDYKLVRDFLPCVRCGVGGLYDRVTKKFYGNGYKDDSGNLTRIGASPLVRKVAGKPDAFVEYIQSDERQALDTGVPGRSGVKVDTTISWGNTYYEKSFVGAVTPNGWKRFYMIHIANNQYWAAYNDDTRQYLFDTANPSLPMRPTGLTGKDHIVVDFSTGNPATIEINGTNCLSIVATPHELTETNNLAIFGTKAEYNNAVMYTGVTRCYDFKCWLDGTLVRDYQPCIKDGKGGFYDAVNDEVVFPVGGDIVGSNIGPTKEIVSSKAQSWLEYIESDGSLYVDTGVKGCTGTKVEITFQGLWRNDLDGSLDSVDMCIMGARSSIYGLNRFYPFAVYKGLASLGYNGYTSTETLLQTGVTYTVTSDFQAGAQTIKINNEVCYTGTDNVDIDTNIPIYLFAANINGTAMYHARMRLYTAKIWQAGKLVRSFQPAINKDGMAILWDKVTQTAFTANKPFDIIGNITGPSNAGTILIMR